MGRQIMVTLFSKLADKTAADKIRQVADVVLPDYIEFASMYIMTRIKAGMNIDSVIFCS